MRMDTLFKPQNKLHNFQDLFKDLSEKKNTVWAPHYYKQPRNNPVLLS